MPQAARVGDPISHTLAFPGLIAGALAGAVIGAAVVATGGAAAVALAAGACAGSGLGGIIGEFVGGFATTETGTIVSGSPNTTTDDRPAAKATDRVVCAWHGSQAIAEGSAIVGINGFPAARVGDRTTCGAQISAGSGRTIIGGPARPLLPVNPEVPFIAEAVVSVLGLIGGVGAIALAQDGLRTMMAARLAAGLATGALGGRIASDIGGRMYGEGSRGQRQMALGGALLGGGLGSGLGGGRLDPFNYRVTQQGLGSNGGNIRVRYVGGKKVLTSTLRGQQYDLNGMEAKPLDYTKRAPDETDLLRKKFDSSERKRWIKNIADNNKNELRKAGLSEKKIENMKNGIVPKGYNVHHIEPLDDGGTNDQSNFILIRNEIEHKLVTNYQKTTTGNMRPGDNQTIEWPYPPDSAVIWPPSDDLSATPTIGDNW